MESKASPPALETPSQTVAPSGGRALLQGRSPKEILSRIVAGDPLRMRPRVAQHLEQQALLLDTDRVVLRALAIAARAAPRYHGQPALEEWLGARVDEAVRELLGEGDGEPRPSAPATPQRPGAFESLAPPLGLDPRAMACACARFHRLPLADRRAFFDLVLHARPLDVLSRASGESATEFARRARRALEALLAAQPANGADA